MFCDTGPWVAASRRPSVSCYWRDVSRGASLLRMRRPRPRLVITVLVIVAVVYAACTSFIWWSMRQPPETFAKVMAKMPGPVPFLLFPFETLWTRARTGTLQAGSPAPDFSLMKLDKSGKVQLSSLTSQQPVVLVFGSYT